MLNEDHILFTFLIVTVLFVKSILKLKLTSITIKT